jgi:hypothetical protein
VNIKNACPLVILYVILIKNISWLLTEASRRKFHILQNAITISYFNGTYTLFALRKHCPTVGVLFAEK